eukprot:6194195-Lingulodinium_polyedra.AAC.1
MSLIWRVICALRAWTVYDEGRALELLPLLTPQGLTVAKILPRMAYTERRASLAAVTLASL